MQWDRSGLEVDEFQGVVSFFTLPGVAVPDNLERDGASPACQTPASAKADAAAQIWAATSASDDSTDVHAEAGREQGPTSRRASKIVPCATGIPRSTT